MQCGSRDKQRGLRHQVKSSSICFADANSTALTWARRWQCESEQECFEIVETVQSPLTWKSSTNPIAKRPRYVYNAGEVKVVLTNLGQQPLEIKRDDRIAQLVPALVQRAGLLEASSLDDTARSGGGFGSTGA
jgi:dUTPase